MNRPTRGDDTPDEFPPGYDEVKVSIADPVDERPGNEDDDGMRHFCVIPPDGDDYCGGCNQPWPCDRSVRLTATELPRRE